MTNIPEVRVGIVAVSRNCFPSSLSSGRMKKITALQPDLFECPIVVETEDNIEQAIEILSNHRCNALVIFLGNFGPEGPETILAQRFNGPVMFVAAEEESDLREGRGDAYCGMLNCSYNINLRNITSYIPKKPVGNSQELCEAITDFAKIARAIIGVKQLKIISFGPRPADFFACNAPIKGLYNIGVEIEENSELDLLVSFKAHAEDKRIPEVVKDMEAELGARSMYRQILPKLAQYELTLLDWANNHKGSKKYVAFANKCWPAFQTEFEFVPCFVNSRLSKIGIPVACEVDIYGVLSEYLGLCISGDPVTLLDINNTVPKNIFSSDDYLQSDLFMGFHCGNTPSCMVNDPHLGYQFIMKRSLEPEKKEPEITRGTLEGNIKAGEITMFRLHSTPESEFNAYIAQGEILDVDCKSFGSIGLIHIDQMERFYRNVLIGKHYPHHTALAFGHHGKLLFDLFAYLGVDAIDFNRPKGMLYPKENPFNY